ncbi:hypothetical protein [Glacieibacterium frigidum]|uniref:Uncharacterized protein n=1 Tax=Glacieibacterium frigidum TaxID=2593303 RepID=A0A552UGT6_9SPHN|nr:hypothetical protein [Glacieibacterium frigidum]TRW17425.1 hypothetical protein FMM06_04470 [Glacieibacterium frigidum]
MKSYLFAVAALVAAAPATAASPFDGTWKADTAASQMSEKPIVYSLAGGTYSCSTCTPPVKIPADGKFHAVKGNPYYDMMSVTVVDPNTIKRMSTKAGKPAGESTATVSPDGKMMANAYTDMSATNGVPVTGTNRFERVGTAVAGAHAISGSWRGLKGNEASESGLNFTLALDGDTLKFSTPTGVTYTAKVDGPEAPVTGDPGWTSVAIKREGPMTLVETDYRDGKKIATYRMTVSADGKTLTGETENFLNGRKSVEVARKQ